jgi:hypothetical protein
MGNNARTTGKNRDEIIFFRTVAETRMKNHKHKANIGKELEITDVNTVTRTMKRNG